jgi:hypothetical protein
MRSPKYVDYWGLKGSRYAEYACGVEDFDTYLASDNRDYVISGSGGSKPGPHNIMQPQQAHTFRI